jgi:hypothetical protein
VADDARAESSYAFLFRAQPDVDHMSPLAWKLLDQGEEVHALASPGLDADSDAHLGFLASHERFQLDQPWRGRGFGAIVRSTFPYAFWFLRHHRVKLVAVEWGSGPRVTRESPTASKGLAVLRRLVGSLLAAWRPDPQQVRSNLVLAATLRGIPVVCLPHGVSVKLAGMNVVGPQAELFEREGTIDWSDRNRFAVCVYDTEDHMRWHLDHGLGDPAVLETWGSLRWSPEWFERNLGLFEEFAWPASPGQLKVVFMAPKWRKRASPEAARELLRGIQELDFVSLAVKGHPRKTGSLDPLKSGDEIDWSRIQDVSPVDSVPLIAAADVVIDVGSSIGIEVVRQGKVLLNAAFLHELTTVFDVIEGSCVRAESSDEAIAYLRAHAAGSEHRVGEEAMGELMRRCVYAGRPQPFDVGSYYADRVRALAEMAR